MTLFLLAVLAVLVGGLCLGVTSLTRRVADVQVTLDDAVADRRSLPQADELNRWLFDLQAAVERESREVRSASVQLRQSTDLLARRVQQVENLTGVADHMNRARRPAAGT